MPLHSITRASIIAVVCLGCSRRGEPAPAPLPSAVPAASAAAMAEYNGPDDLLHLVATSSSPVYLQGLEDGLGLRGGLVHIRVEPSGELRMGALTELHSPPAPGSRLHAPEDRHSLAVVASRFAAPQASGSPQLSFAGEHINLWSLATPAPPSVARYDCPADCASGQLGMSQETMVRLCSANATQLVTHVWMAGDGRGERVVLNRTADYWVNARLFSFRGGHYLTEGYGTNASMYRLGKGRWERVQAAPTFDSTSAHAIDSQGRFLSLRQNRIFRLSADMRQETELRIAEAALERVPADAPPSYLGSPDEKPGVSIVAPDFRTAGARLGYVAAVNGDMVIATAYAGLGTLVFSSRPTGKVKALPSALDQAAVLANTLPPTTVDAPCREMFVPIERTPSGTPQGVLAVILSELKATDFGERVDDVVVVDARHHGKPSRGAVVRGAQRYSLAKSIAAHFAVSPVQPPTVSCTLPELVRAANVDAPTLAPTPK